mgnify:CR=1 FL=1
MHMINKNMMVKHNISDTLPYYLTNHNRLKKYTEEKPCGCIMIYMSNTNYSLLTNMIRCEAHRND